MKRKVIIGLLILAVAVLAFGYYQYRLSALRSSSLPELFAYIPRDANLVVYLDESSVRSSPFLTNLLKEIGPAPKLDSEYEEFVRATGFDYTRDLDSALLIQSASAGPFSSFIVAEAKLDRERLMKYAGAKSAQIEYAPRSKQGRPSSVSGFVFPGSETDSRDLVLAFLCESRVGIARRSKSSPKGTDAVARLQDNLRNLAAAPADPDQQERLGRFSGASFLLLMRSKNAMAGMQSSANWSKDVAGLLQKTEWVSLAARPEGEKLRVALEGECASTIDAMQLSLLLQAVRLLVASVLKDPAAQKGITPQQSALLEHLARNGQIVRDGSRVQFRVELTAAQLASIAAIEKPAGER